MPRQDQYVLQVQPPLGGVNKRVGYQQEPPFTAYRIVNFWSVDPFTGRAVLSTRPPLSQFVTPGTGVGTVNFVNRVNGVREGYPLQSMVSGRTATVAGTAALFEEQYYELITAGGTPMYGQVAFDNANQTLITEIYIHEFDFPTELTAVISEVPFRVIVTDDTSGESVQATVTAMEDSGDFYTLTVSSVVASNGASSVSLSTAITVTLGPTQGTLYFWDGTDWEAATDSTEFPAIVETGVPIFGATLLQKVYFAQFDDAPAVFDYATGELSTLQSSVTDTGVEVPTDCRMFWVWQGALWMAGQLASPHILYGSRIGDATDYDFAAPITDTGGAFFTGGEDEGILRGPITAGFPHTEDTMIVSTTEGMVAWRAHPRKGGVPEDISDDYILGQGAWCKKQDGTAYFVTRLGVMELAAGDRSKPVYISDSKIPEELKALPYDYENPTVNLEYSSRWNCLYITVRGERAQAWRYDLGSGAFERMVLSNYPYRLMEFFPEVTENTCGVLFAGQGGLERFDRLGTESFDSEVIFNPIRVSPDQSQKSFIMQANMVFGGDTPTSDGFIRMSGGADAEDAVQRFLAGQYEQWPIRNVSRMGGQFFPRMTCAAVVFSLFVQGE